VNASSELRSSHFVRWTGFLLFLFITSTNLVACDSGLSSQIEKCVQAGIAAGGPYKNSTEKADVEVAARVFCLRAASGKE